MFIVYTRPTSFFGEPLRDGSLRIAEFCALKSFGLLLVVTACLIFGGSIFESFIVFPIILLVLTIFKLILNVLFYKGIINDTACFVTMWLWVYAIQTVLLMVCAIGGAVAFIILLPALSYLGLIFFMFVFMYCAVIKYFCQVVYSHRCEMYQPIIMVPAV